MANSTKFADMSVTQRNKWVDWANSHDWGSKPAFATEAGNIKVFCAAKDDCGDWYDDSYIATSPADLRGWAGY
jgi:hypothetical protein